MVILFCGMSGIDIHSSLLRFINEYKPFRSALFEDKVPQLLKIDTEIETVFYEMNISVEKSSSVWVDVILHQSYSVLEKLWNSAFDNILKKVTIAQNENRAVFINLHSCYFHNRTKEYISLQQIDKLRLLKVNKIITFIDDIYDVHHRLTRPGGIYHGTEPTMIEMIHRYFRLLDWRSKETMMSRFLANHLKCKNYVFAVKHPYDTLFNLIFEERFPTAYLSHPISEVRRLEKEINLSKADSIKEEITRLSEYLTSNFTAFLPTTIDEYRIKSETKNTKKDGYDEGSKVYLPLLTKRWEGDFYKNPHHIIYQFSGFTDRNELWQTTKPKHINSDVSQLLSVFVDTISDQVSTRDYTLVEQSQLIIIYRPLFNGNGSRGVFEEFNYFKTLSNDSNYQSSCFIYCPIGDIYKYYENIFNNKVNYYLKRNLLKLKDNINGRIFEGLTTSECEKLARKIPSKSFIFDLFTEVIENHNIVINVKNTNAPLGKDEVKDFKIKFVKRVLDDYSLIEEYKLGATLFISQELSIEQFCNTIKENLKTINHDQSDIN